MDMVCENNDRVMDQGSFHWWKQAIPTSVQTGIWNVEGKKWRHSNTETLEEIVESVLLSQKITTMFINFWW